MANDNSSAKKEKPRKYGLGKKLLLLVATIVFFLAAGEAVMRWIFPASPEDRWKQHHFRVGALGFDELNQIMEPDPELFWRVKPNLKDHFLTGFVGTDTLLHFKVDTDSRGLREMGEASTDKNILFLGDSCTFGIGVRVSDTCAARTGFALGLGVRNLSCPGYTIYQGRTLLDRLGWDPKPSALIVGFGFNDRLMWDGLTDPEHAALMSERSSFLARHSRLVYCFEHALEGSLRLLKKNSAVRARRVPPELFRAEAARLCQTAKAGNIPVVFLFWPRIEWMNQPGAGHPYAETIHDLADEKRVKILDLTEAFRRGGGEALYLDGIHTTPEGHRIAAEELTACLEAIGVAQ